MGAVQRACRPVRTRRAALNMAHRPHDMACLLMRTLDFADQFCASFVTTGSIGSRDEDCELTH